MTDAERKLQAKIMTRKQLNELVGPDHASGVIRAGCSTEEYRVFMKHVAEQGQPTKGNRANRRRVRKLKQKARRKRGL